MRYFVTLLLLAWVFMQQESFSASEWVEDFRGLPFGFDQPWSNPQVIAGIGESSFKSDGEIGCLSLASRNAVRVVVQTARIIPWSNSAQYIQIQLCSLSPGAQFRTYALLPANETKPVLLHEETGTTAGTSRRIITIDCHEKIPTSASGLHLRLELIKDLKCEKVNDTTVYLDWVKVGLSRQTSDSEVSIEQARYVEGAAGKPGSIQWTASPRSDSSSFTLLLSRDSSFACCTRTIHGRVADCKVEVPDTLELGRWYWELGANDGSRISEESWRQTNAQGPRSFVIEGNAATVPLKFGHFNIRAGSQGFGSVKKFTNEPKIVEQAREMLALGCDAYKFLLGGDAEPNGNYVHVYQDMSSEIRSKSHSLTELIENEKAYQTLLDLPFTYFIMWVQGMDIDFELGKGGGNAAALRSEYKQIYDLTQYLIKTYKCTGKIFLIGHWEGDNMLVENQDFYRSVPSDVVLKDMQAWLANRQRAVSDARNALSDSSGVEVYNYAEVNAITPVLGYGVPRMINAVLPFVAVDLVSYSAYNCMNHTDELPERAWDHLNYIQRHAKFTGAWPGSRPVFIGEYGIPSPSVPGRATRNMIALKSGASWGSPINLYYSVYTQLPNGNSALIELDGSKNEEYRNIQKFTGRMHVLKQACRVWLNRNPTEFEANRLAIVFDSTMPHEIVRDIVNSREFHVIVDNDEYCDNLFKWLGIPADKSRLRAKMSQELDNGEVDRWKVLKTLLDSDEFSQIMGQKAYEDILARNLGFHVSAREASRPTTRSDLYEAAIDGEECGARNIRYMHVDHVTDELRKMYQPLFMSTPE